MAGRYLKIYADFRESLTALGDAEKGRLFDAMLLYAACGEEPALGGNERIIWPVAKANIDRQMQAYDEIVEKRRAAGRRSGEARANKAQHTRTHANMCAQDKDKEKNKKNDPPFSFPPAQVEHGGVDAPAKKRARSMPPSVEEVAAYCSERGNGIDPVAFVDFYASKGWKVGREPMRDWQAAVRTWERRRDGPAVGRGRPATTYAQHEVDGAALSRLLVPLDAEGRLA